MPDCNDTQYLQQAKYRRTYERHSVLSLDAVFSAIDQQDLIRLEDGVVRIASIRLRVFAKKGVACDTCGIEGSYFAVERHNGCKKWHLNLYCANGRMMTVDHTIPRSKGGRRIMSNLQPMCANCNHTKGPRMPLEAVVVG